MRRLNSQYRPIVNSVRERVRACVRNARKTALFGRREKRPGRFWKPRPASVFGADFERCETAVTMGAKAPIPPARDERFCAAKSSEYTTCSGPPEAPALGEWTLPPKNIQE